MVAVLGFSKEQIVGAVREMYTLVATRPETPLHFPVGEEACSRALYDPMLVKQVPAAALESFAGVGCPFRAGVIKQGDSVLDVGSGSGTDAIIASRMVGAHGRVWALDLTAAMREKLESVIAAERIENLSVLAGNAESIPLPDRSVDVVTSNGVLNLVPDKRRAVAEIFRVLKPGGYVQLADIVIASPVTPDCKDDPRMWAECVVGATVDENYLNMFRDAGFEDLEILRDYDYFAYSPSEETRQVAKQFGAYALELRMKRSHGAPPKWIQWLKRLDPRRLFRDVRRRGLSGVVGFVLALFSCYGTLAVVALMSAMGVTMAVNEGVWAGAIVAASALTTAIIGLGMRKHRSAIPLMIAILGTALITYTMFFEYALVVEIIGFTLLGAATLYDFNLRRWAKVPAGRQRVQKRRTGFVRDGTPT